MPDDKTAAKVLTGSTGNAAIDMSPRAAFIGFCGVMATILCGAFGVDATMTGLVTTAAGTGAVLGAAAFDATLRKRL